MTPAQRRCDHDAHGWTDALLCRGCGITLAEWRRWVTVALTLAGWYEDEMNEHELRG